MPDSERNLTNQFWLNSGGAWLIYLLAWVTFAAAFMAVFLLSNQLTVARAFQSVFFVILPALVLGIGVIWLLTKLPLPDLQKAWTIAIHLVLAFVYPIVWVALVMGISTAKKFFTEPDWVCKLPPDHVLHWHFFAGVMIYLTLVSVTYTIDRIRKAEKQKQETEIWMLRSQINPHFLFNTLHSLLALIRNQPALAEKSLEQFAGLLRYTLRVNRDTLDGVPFSEEWAFTNDYLDLERLRLDNRLIVETDFDEQAMNCFVPVFLLQPIIENSIRYAISPRASGGTIWITAKCENDWLLLTVRDDGTNSVDSDSTESSGVALQITRDRLIKYFGKKISFEAKYETNQGFIVKIQTPIVEEPI